MEAVKSMMGKNDLSSKIVMAAAAILFLMILFPPKQVTQTVFGVKSSASVGYQFILSDPAGAQKGAVPLPSEVTNELYAGSGVEYGKLFLQMLIVSMIACGAVVFMSKQPLSTARQQTSSL